MKEKIVIAEGRYQLGIDGSVYDCSRKCHVRLFESQGYKVASVKVQGVFKSVYIHRLIAVAYIPNPHGYPVVNHKDSNRSNNDIKNLEWCTQADNVAHAQEKGAYKQNARTLTPQQVLAIKKLHNPQRSIRSIALELGVSPGAARDVIRGRSYKWVTS